MALATCETTRCTCEFPGVLCDTCEAAALAPVAPRCAVSSCNTVLRDGEWRYNWMGWKVCCHCDDELYRHH